MGAPEKMWTSERNPRLLRSACSQKLWREMAQKLASQHLMVGEQSALQRAKWRAGNDETENYVCAIALS